MVGAQLMLVYELMRCDLGSALAHDLCAYEDGEPRRSAPSLPYSGICHDIQRWRMPCIPVLCH